MPERFWVVVKPASVVELSDILVPCTFSGLMNKVRGGLHEDEITGIYADQDEATASALRLLGKYPVRPQESAFFEVVVNVMVVPKIKALTARKLGAAAVEAVRNAIRLAEARGHQHRLGNQVALGISEVVELRDLTIASG